MGSVHDQYVKLHVDARLPYVQVALASLNKHDLEIVVQVGQTACHDTSA